jgi:hypothetical protein
LEVFDEDVLDDAGVGVGRDGQAQGGGQAEKDDQESPAHAGFLSGRAGGLPAVGWLVGMGLRTARGGGGY